MKLYSLGCGGALSEAAVTSVVHNLPHASRSISASY